MVKGSWDRKNDSATARREEKRMKKSKDKIELGETVRAKLLSGSFQFSRSSSIMVWCSTAEERTVCSDWFRTDSCSLKKCKLGHRGASVSHLSGVYGGDIPSKPNETMCERPVLLADVAARDAKRIKFISIDGRCVFDYLCPENWNNFVFECASATAGSVVATKTLNLRDDADVEGAVALTTAEDSTTTADDPVCAVAFSALRVEQPASTTSATSCSPANDTKLSSRTPPPDNLPTLFVNIWRCASTALLPFLSDVDMVHVSQCCAVLRKQCMENDTFRSRRKELFSRRAPSFNKLRRAEQKKKIKQANVRKPDPYTSTVKRCHG